jgi:hypothetical protein
MTSFKVSVVCCDNSSSQLSQIVDIKIDGALLEERLLDTADQILPAGEAKGLHNAAHHSQHGPVTYLQQVNEGGFYVLTGTPENLQETFFGPGSYVAFIDDKGPGHASRVGPDGVNRTFRMLQPHLEVGS